MTSIRKRAQAEREQLEAELNKAQASEQKVNDQILHIE